MEEEENISELSTAINPIKEGLRQFLTALLCTYDERVTAFIEHHSHLKELRAYLKSDIAFQIGRVVNEKFGVQAIAEYLNGFDANHILALYATVQNKLDGATFNDWGARRAVNPLTAFSWYKGTNQQQV